MVNGKCRQGERIIATELATSNHSSYITSPKCLTNMSKSTKISSRAQATLLPHRKVFMITEKSGENDEQRGTADATTAGRKRKMILIMDEKPQADTVDKIQRPNGIKHVKTETKESTTTSSVAGGAPKLLFFANSVDDQLSQKIEEILPEILSRIQWKNGRVIDGNESSNLPKQQQHIQNDKSNSNDNSNSNGNGNSNARDNKHTTAYKTAHQQRVQGLLHEEYSDNSNSELANTKTIKNANYISHHSNNSNLMLLGAAAAATVASHAAETVRRITLPPKKNLSKFQRQINDNSGEHIISAATPVIVSTTSLNKTSNQVSAIRTFTTDNNKNLNSSKSNFQQQINKINQINNDNIYVQQQHQKQNQNQQYHQNIQQHHHHNNNLDNKNHNHKQNNNNINNNNDNNDEKTTNSEKSSIVVQQQNINLTGDFLFLMKMLPMLEKTPEPRKSQVKLLIEKIMKQCVAGDNPQ